MPVYSNGSSSLNFDDFNYSQLQRMASNAGVSVEDLLSNATGFSGILTGGSNSSTQSPLAKMANDYGIPFNQTTSDYLMEHYLNEKSAENAWNRSVFSAQHQNQWLVDDLKKAGLNPFLAMSGMNAAAPTSSAGSVSGGSITSRANIKATNENDLIKALISSIGSILGLGLIAFGKKK